ncbi:MAG: hypothetical protein DRJ98_07915 [Thermoprotei archaeon]|nr:MAG: hypothetical protein DRJ98_07915 [Thermoprotei archaeon]RLF18301.1 MAG: hypothetical protein DRN06_01865 [Thermoprotei archaeon]
MRAIEVAVSIPAALIAGLLAAVSSVNGELLLALQIPMTTLLLVPVYVGGEFSILLLVLMFTSILVPIVEETGKAFGYILPLLGFRSRFNLSFAFLLGALSGFSFGVIENFIYANALSGLSPEKYAAIMWFRWIACLPLHMISTGVGCLCLAYILEKLGLREPNALALFMGLMPAYVIHGTYNLIVSLFPPVGF